MGSMGPLTNVTSVTPMTSKMTTKVQKSDFLLCDEEHETVNQCDLGDPYDPKIDLEMK